MRAFVISQLTGPTGGAVTEVAEPEGAHDWADGRRLLVEVHAAGISFPDLLQSTGSYQHGRPPPYVAGGEASGVVLEAPDDSPFAPGDRVAGLCLWGALAERALLLPQYTLRIPPRMTFVAGAALQLNYATAWFACYRVGLRPGERVLILGAAGGVGTAAIQVTQALGAEPIALVSTPEKARVARAVGATTVLLGDAGWLARLRELTGGRGVDVVIDPVGGEQFVDALRALDIGGRLAVVGFAAGTIPQVRVNRLLLRDLSVVGVALAPYVERHPHLAARLAADLEQWAAAGVIRPHVGAVLDLSDAGAAIALLGERRALGKVVVRIRPDADRLDEDRLDADQPADR